MTPDVDHWFPGPGPREPLNIAHFRCLPNSAHSYKLQDLKRVRETRGLIYKTLRRFHPKSVRRHKSSIRQNLHKNPFINPSQGKIVRMSISSQKSPYMELTTPSFTIYNLICISFPSTWYHVQHRQRYKTLWKYEIRIINAMCAWICISKNHPIVLE